MNTQLTVIKSGILSTVQDLGRIGYQSQGVSQGGALDKLSAQLANILVHNPLNAPVIEITLGGLEIEFSQASTIALTGADCNAQLSGRPVYTGWRYCAQAGERLKLGISRYGMRSYLAIAGNILSDHRFGSASTDLNAKFGGHAQGSALQESDQLLIQKTNPILSNCKHHGCNRYNGCNGHHGIKLPTYSNTIRVIREDDTKLLAPHYFDDFLQHAWHLGKQSNRMGFRLESFSVELSHQLSLYSQAVEPGIIQLPQNGQPIILMADAQTTGGYPRLAKVITADLPALAQTRLGEAIQFKEVSRFEAFTALQKQQRYLAQIKKQVIYESD